MQDQMNATHAPLKRVPWKLSGSQVIADFTQPTQMLESCHAHIGTGDQVAPICATV